MNPENPLYENDEQQKASLEYEEPQCLEEETVPWGIGASSTAVMDCDAGESAVDISETSKGDLDALTDTPPAHIGKTKQQVSKELGSLWGAGKSRMTVDDIDRVVDGMRSEWDMRGWEDPMTQGSQQGLASSTRTS